MTEITDHKARADRLLEALQRIANSADNKNWRKPELVKEALSAITADPDFKKDQDMRDSDIQNINSLYGAPGERYDTEDGRKLLCDLLEDYGLAAFSDTFVMHLAAKHRAHDFAECNRAEARYRREQRGY